MSDTRGLYAKYTVIRTDGRDAPGEKHEDCQYFVLDLSHDRAAREALSAYKDAVWNSNRTLGEEINGLLWELYIAHGRNP